MVNFKAGAVCLLAGFGLNGVSAFAPQKNSVGKKLDLGRDNMILDTNNNKNVNNDYTKMLAGSMNMVAGGAAAEEYYEGVRIGPPPDLPSLLLHNRIVYIGMPLVPAVTELIIAELLYLNYESTSDPITMYINSSGTTTANGQSVGFETEAFAIADVMKYVRPPVHTVALGQAFGAAAMLLSQGTRGKRSSLPNATIMLNQPKSMARGQASDIAIRAREVAANRRTTCDLIARACQKPFETVMEDCSRVKYLSPHEAVEYGLIDRVLQSDSSLPVKPSFIQQLSS